MVYIIMPKYKTKMTAAEYKAWKATTIAANARLARYQTRRRLRRRILANPNIKNGIYFFKRVVNAYDDTGLVVDGTHLKKPTVVGGSPYMSFNNTLAGGVTGYGTFSYYFSLQSLPNVTEFTTLFDAYQITKVVVKFIPICDNTSAASGVIPTNYWLHTVIDHDDANMPTATAAGLQDLQQYASYKTSVINRRNSRVVKPRTAIAVYNGGFLGYGENSKNGWYDCSNTNIQHYALKGIIEGPAALGGTNNEVWFKIETTYYLKFKGVR